MTAELEDTVYSFSKIPLHNKRKKTHVLPKGNDSSNDKAYTVDGVDNEQGKLLE